MPADVIEMLDQLGIATGDLHRHVARRVGDDGRSRRRRQNASLATIINDVGPDVDPSGIDRILTYVGKDQRFKSWEEAASAISGNYGSSFDRYRRTIG